MKTLNVRALQIEPLNDVKFIDLELSSTNVLEDTVVWETSSVCNSERRRFSLTKSHDDKEPFIGGHEAVGYIESDVYIKRRYALLPHSNCVTRGDSSKCKFCSEGKENLCERMEHAGLDKGTPSGFCEKNFVQKSQLFDVTEIDPFIAPFLEPLSCVIRSWSLSGVDLKNGVQNINIVGGGPIGCLHAFYINKINNLNQISIIESSEERRSVLKDIFNDYSNIKILSDSYLNTSPVSVMAASSSSSFLKAKELTEEDGVLILFSGFDQNDFKENNFIPEIIHRNEFKFYEGNIYLTGSSGYTKEDLIRSKLELLNFDECKNIITGVVHGLESKEIIRYDGVVEKFDNPVLVHDIRGDLSNHIKIQYRHIVE
tara:strand:+ start:3453 stop:4565 length:1113 start_codon:yes stop_codon:yes gene_type:complete